MLPGTEEIMDSLRIICQEENKISQIAAGLTSLEKGHIRIGTIQSISYHWLPDILRDFSESYPNIRFELTVDGFSALKEKYSQISWTAFLCLVILFRSFRLFRWGATN